MTRGAPSFPALAELFHHGHTRVPDAWRITGPAMAGLWWCATDQEVVGTPLLLRRADEVESDGERVGLLLATEPRFRDRWLTVMALRLAEIGRRNDVADLCRQIDALGAAAAAVHDRVACDRIAPTPDAALELSLFGTPADQPAAATLPASGTRDDRCSHGGRSRPGDRSAESSRQQRPGRQLGCRAVTADARQPGVRWVCRTSRRRPAVS